MSSEQIRATAPTPDADVIRPDISAAAHDPQFYYINPFTAPACNIFGLKSDAHACKQYASWRSNNLLSIQRVLSFKKILSRANTKKKTKRFKDFIFRTFIGHFEVTSWQ